MEDTNEESIMKKFKLNVLSQKVIPCINTDLDDIITNRRWWERTEIFLEYFYEILLIASFASIFIESKIISGILIGSIGCCSRSITNSVKNQKKLTEKLNNYLKSFSIKELIPDDFNISHVLTNDVESQISSTKSRNLMYKSETKLG